MARNDLFFDPLQSNDEEAAPAPAPADPRASEAPAVQRSIELLRVRNELEKMARTGKRT